MSKQKIPSEASATSASKGPGREEARGADSGQGVAGHLERVAAGSWELL